MKKHSIHVVSNEASVIKETAPVQTTIDLDEIKKRVASIFPDATYVSYHHRYETGVLFHISISYNETITFDRLKKLSDALETTLISLDPHEVDYYGEIDNPTVTVRWEQ